MLQPCPGGYNILPPRAGIASAWFFVALQASFPPPALVLQRDAPLQGEGAVAVTQPRGLPVSPFGGLAFETLPSRRDARVCASGCMFWCTARPAKGILPQPDNLGAYPDFTSATLPSAAEPLRCLQSVSTERWLGKLR